MQLKGDVISQALKHPLVTSIKDCKIINHNRYQETHSFTALMHLALECLTEIAEYHHYNALKKILG